MKKLRNLIIVVLALLVLLGIGGAMLRGFGGPDSPHFLPGLLAARARIELETDSSGVLKRLAIPSQDLRVERD